MLARSLNRVVIELHRTYFELKVALNLSFHVLADIEAHRLGEVGRGVQEKNSLNQFFGMLHLVNRLLLYKISKLAVMPVFTHLGMQKILIDRGQFLPKRLLKRSNDF